MSYKLDYKVEVWQRCKFHKEENCEIVKKMLEEGKNTDEIIEYLDGDADADFQEIWETCQELTPEENDGQSTVELLDNNDESIWRNGKI